MPELRATLVHRDAAMTIVVVEAARITSVGAKTRWHLFGRVEPVAVVVSTARGPYAFDAMGKPADLEVLTQNVASLEAMIIR